MQITWTDALNVALQVLTAYLAARNHKSIVKSRECVHDGKIVSEANQDFMKDMLHKILVDLKNRK